MLSPPEAGGDGGDDLRDEPVEVGVGGPLHRQVVVAQVVDGLDMNNIAKMVFILWQIIFLNPQKL